MGSSQSTEGTSPSRGGSSSAADEPDTVVSPPVELRSVEIRPAVGSMISRYVVLEELGRGGMGRVLRAYDPKLQREVALKEVHRGALDEDATARLVLEARAMAKLSHPHVVAIYDVEEVGAHEVVLVMELVRGTTLQRWLAATERDWSTVVAMLVQAGRGLAAAHAAGVLHRDFKPANVLVSEDGTAKVMDFGLAKVAGGSASSGAGSVSVEEVADELTHAGTVMGTPLYMAPEQHFAEPLSPAADQYAFCVALWAALCGAPPFTAATIKELVARKQAERPAWPKAGVPRAIVDAIARGLSPKPEERWPSMEALLEALSWDPKRRRNRWLVAAASLGVLGAGGVAVATWAQARADRCSGAEQQLAGIWDDTRSAGVQAAILGLGKSYATPVWERTQRELDAYARSWVAMHTETCEATTVRGEQSAAVMDLRMACLHRARQELRATVDTLADADAKVVQNAHELTAGLRPLSRCADVEALAEEVEPPLPEEAEAVDAARLELARAESLERAGRYEAAREAVDAAEELLVGVEYGPVRTELALREGWVLDELGEYEASQTALTEALELASQWRQWNAMSTAANHLIYVVGYKQRRMEEGLWYRPLAMGLSRGQPRREASLRTSLAAILDAQGKHEEAEVEYRAALSLLEKALGPDHPHVSEVRGNLAVVLNAQGKHEEAEAELRVARSLLEKALGPDHPRVAISRSSLATVLNRRGKHEEAEAEHRAALSLLEKALGPDHPGVLTSRANLANVLAAQGKLQEAEAEHRAVLSLREKVLGPDHPAIAESRINVASALAEQGKLQEAEAEFRAALSLCEKALGPDHPLVAYSRSNLASTLAEQGKLEEAEAEHRVALSLWEKTLGPGHPEVATTRNNLALVLAKRGKHEEAEAEHRAALSLREKVLGPDHPEVAESRSNLADVLLERDRAAEALPLAERAWEPRQQGDVPQQRRAKTAFTLARALWAVHPTHPERTRARALAEDALRSYRAAGEAHAKAADEVQQWLDDHPLG